MSKPENPPAFPKGVAFTTYGTIVDKDERGMTLRDYFAAKALPELVREALDLDHKSWDATGQHAYLIADAMLRARATEGGEDERE